MKGCFSGRNVEESVELLKKFDELRNQLLINHAVDERKRRLNPKVLDSLDKIDSIKMQVIELKKQIHKIDMKRAEVVCLDKVRSLSERKARRDAQVHSQRVLETLRSCKSRKSRKSRKSKKRKSKSKSKSRKARVRSKSRASKRSSRGSRNRSQVRFARCVACPERGYNISRKSRSKSVKLKKRSRRLSRKTQSKSRSLRSSKFTSESLNSTQLRKLRLRKSKSKSRKNRKSKSAKTRKPRTKSNKIKGKSRSISRKSKKSKRSRSRRAVKPFSPLVELKPAQSHKRLNRKRKRSKSTSRIAKTRGNMHSRLHSECTNTENLDINIFSQKQSHKTGILKNSVRNSMASTRRNQSSKVNELNCEDVLNFSKTNPDFNKTSTKSARFADSKPEDFIKTIKLSSNRKSSVRGQVAEMCDQVTKSMRKRNIKTEIKVLDQEILDIGKELEEKLDYVKSKITRKLKRRGLKI